MEAAGLPRVRLAGAKGSGKQRGDSQPCVSTHCSAPWFFMPWQCHRLDSSTQTALGGGQAGH